MQIDPKRRGSLSVLGLAALPLSALVALTLWPVAVRAPAGRAAPRGPGAIVPATPYSLVTHLGEARLIESPVPELWGRLSRRPVQYLIEQSAQVKRGVVGLEADVAGGRVGGGLLRIASPLQATPRAEARFVLHGVPGGSALLRGFVRYVPPEHLPVRRAVIPEVPTAFVTWEFVEAPKRTGVAWPPALIVPPIDQTPDDGPAAAPGHSRRRSRELLGLRGHARELSSLGKWIPIEVPIPSSEAGDGQASRGARERPVKDTSVSLVIRLECDALLGEVQFSDLTLSPEPFARRILREGAYRYLPATESTTLLKKMVLAGSSYRESLLALPPSRFVFDLVMPHHPVLEFQTSVRAADSGTADRVVFTVVVEETTGERIETVYRKVRSASTDPAWRPESLDLSPFADRPVRLVLKTTSEDAGSEDRPARAVWGTPVLLNREAQSPRTNVVLLTIDCMREDRLGVHGYRRACTPVLDRVARGGVDFLNAYSTSHHTYIVLPMLMTGRMSRYEWIGSFNVIDPAVPTLADILAGRGYLVAGFCEDYYYNGFWKGFPARPYLEGIKSRPHDAVLLDEAWGFVRSHPGTPLFTWIHLKGPHPPCTGVPPRDRFLVDEGLAPLWQELRRRAGVQDDVANWPAVLDITRRADSLPPDVITKTLQVARALYDGSMLDTDRLIGRFLDRLDKAGVLDRTLLVVSSDHGIQLREESPAGRGPQEEGMRVPLIISGPGLSSEPRRVTDRVSTIRITPTILDYLGIDPARVAPGGFTGESLLPLCRGRKPDGEPPVFALFNSLKTVWFGEHKYEVTDSVLGALQRGTMKLGDPPRHGETLLELSGRYGERPLEITPGRTETLVRARRTILEFWNSLDSGTARGAMNPELVEFFQRAGYMK